MEKNFQVCMDKEVEVFFQPCGHITCCQVEKIYFCYYLRKWECLFYHFNPWESESVYLLLSASNLRKWKYLFAALRDKVKKYAMASISYWWSTATHPSPPRIVQLEWLTAQTAGERLKKDLEHSILTRCDISTINDLFISATKTWMLAAAQWTNWYKFIEQKHFIYGSYVAELQWLQFQLAWEQTRASAKKGSQKGRRGS